MTVPLSTFPQNLYRTVFPGSIAAKKEGIYLSGELWSFQMLDSAMEKIPGVVFGEFTADQDAPEKTEKSVGMKQSELRLGVHPGWAKGYQRALKILERTCLNDPREFFRRETRLIEVSIITSQNALVAETGTEKVRSCQSLKDLAVAVALWGMKVFFQKITPSAGAAAIHSCFSKCEALGSTNLMMARMWMNLTLQIGGENAVMFPDKTKYEVAAKKDEESFAHFLLSVIAWNKKYKIFA